ncbi:MAG: arsenate reductase/protein-tyrosine-phosphatase family protein, partial [Gemmatimonadaceae bacterium]
MRVLFVCTGNTCRSPMAESVATRMAAERALGDVTFSSAGTSAWDGAPASDGALLVAMERGLDLSQHRARMLSRELVAESDLILVMSPHHRDRATAL